jgi:RNA polymerase sigma factor (sigma-70 family)
MTHTAKLTEDMPPDLDDSSPEIAASQSQNGKPGSIVASLFRQHARRVQHFMGFRLWSSEDGQEASQEVFLKLWKREAEGGLREDATSYLFSATQTAIIDTERARASRGHGLQASAEHLDILPAAEPDQDEALHWRRAMSHLVNVVEGLPELARKAFLLHYFADMSYDQIAAELGVNRRTVERHIARATSHCRARMRNYL